MNEIKKILEDLGAFKVGHTGRKLGDHLLGTYKILVNMNAPPEACMAGAFHSVYGTNAFKNKIVEHDSRNKIKKLITPEVERLVYIFSIVNRPMGFETGKIFLNGTNQEVEIDEKTLYNLRLIEIANLLEQNSSLSRYPKLLEMYHEHSKRT